MTTHAGAYLYRSWSSSRPGRFSGFGFRKLHPVRRDLMRPTGTHITPARRELYIRNAYNSELFY
jgi:hypothetical protein